MTLIAASALTFFVEDTPTAILVRQVLGAVAEFEKATLIAKLAAARSRTRMATGKKVEGLKSHAEGRPDVVKLAKVLAPKRPKGGKNEPTDHSGGNGGERGPQRARAAVQSEVDCRDANSVRKAVRMSTPFVFLSHSDADTEAARKPPKEKPLPMNLIKRFAPIIAGVIALVIGFVAGHFIWP